MPPFQLSLPSLSSIRLRHSARKAGSSACDRIVASLRGDDGLITKAVQRPRLQLALLELARGHLVMERVAVVITGKADFAQDALKCIRCQATKCGISELVHRRISIPSYPTSQLLLCKVAASGERSFRMGLVLLICT